MRNMRSRGMRQYSGHPETLKPEIQTVAALPCVSVLTPLQVPSLRWITLRRPVESTVQGNLLQERRVLPCLSPLRNPGQPDAAKQ
uniref:Uncharacterized protein n=1 Tax=Sphaerodactylus townsendi TaxID=933632 RepID=A0ACB8FDA6_9SAUR